MTSDEIIKKQTRLLTALHTAKVQQNYYANLCFTILEEANSFSKETLNVEKINTAETEEERHDKLGKLSKSCARLEDSKQALLALQKISEKVNRKYNVAKATYNRFCQRHGLKEVVN